MRPALVDHLGAGLAAWVNLVGRRPRTVLALALLVFGALAMWSVPRLGISTNTAEMISPELSWRKTFDDFRAAFPQLQQTLLVVVDAPTVEDAEEVRDALAARLTDAGAIRELFVPGGHFFTRNALLLMPAGMFDEFADRMVAAQPVLARLAREPGLLGTMELAESVARHGHDPAAQAPLFNAIADTVGAAALGAPTALSWRRLLQGEDHGGTQAFLVVQPELDFDQLVPAAEAIATVREAAASVASPPARVRLTGQVAMEHEELLSVRQGASLAGMLAVVMVIFVLLVAFRSVRLLMATLLTLACGLIGTAAFAAETVGQLNLVSAAFAVLYVGLGIDFSIHFCLRYRESMAVGGEVVGALRETAMDTGSALLLCAVTTAVGFLAFFPTAFVGVSELGLISGVGMLIAFVSTMTVLPALLAVLPDRRFRPLPMRSGMPARLVPLVRHHPRWIVAVAGLLVLLGLPALSGVRFDNNPLNLRDPASESISTLNELRAGGDGSIHRMSLIVADADSEARMREHLEALPEVYDTEGYGDLVRRDQSRRLQAIFELRFVMALPPDVGPSPPVPAFEDFERIVSSLQAALGAMELAAALRLSSALTDFVSVLHQLPAEQHEQRLAALQQALVKHLPGALRGLTSALAVSAPIVAADLPAPLAGRWLAEDGRRRIEILPAGDLGDAQLLERFVTAVRDVAPDATGLPVVHLEAGRVVAQSFLAAMSYAAVIILALLSLLFGSMLRALLVLTPLLAATLLTAATTTLVDIPFNYANVVTLPLLLGIGVDNGIHMVRRHAGAGPQSDVHLRSSTSRAILYSGITTMVSFGNLAFAGHPGIASMGVLLTIGMSITLLTTLVLLPALLASRRIS